MHIKTLRQKLGEYGKQIRTTRGIGYAIGAEDGTVLFDNDTNVSGLPNHLDRPEIQDALTNGEGESIRS